MTLEFLTSFFGWMAVLNIALLMASALMMLALRNWAVPLHARMFGLSQPDVQLTIYRWLGTYKMLTILFCIIPYFALQLV